MIFFNFLFIDRLVETMEFEDDLKIEMVVHSNGHHPIRVVNLWLFSVGHWYRNLDIVLKKSEKFSIRYLETNILAASSIHVYVCLFIYLFIILFFMLKRREVMGMHAQYCNSLLISLVINLIKVLINLITLCKLEHGIFLILRIWNLVPFQY